MNSEEKFPGLLEAAVRGHVSASQLLHLLKMPWVVQKLVERLVGLEENLWGIYDITVDYSQISTWYLPAFQRLVRDSRLLRFSPENSPTNFCAMTRRGRVEKKVCLLHFDHKVFSEDVDLEMEKNGLDHASFEDALALDLAYPSVSGDVSIVFLGSAFGHDSLVYVPCLMTQENQKGIVATTVTDGFREGVCFAGVVRQ